MNIFKKLVGLILFVAGILSCAFFALGTLLCIFEQIETEPFVTVSFLIITVLCFLLARAGYKLFKTPIIVRNPAKELLDTIEFINDVVQESEAVSEQPPVKATRHNNLADMVAVECSGCGAPATVKRGCTVKCEYCGTYIQG